MEYEVKLEQGVPIIEVSGSLDMHANETARKFVQETLRTMPPAFLLDLSGLQFLKSSGYQVLFELAEEARKLGIPVGLVAPPENIKTIMNVFRLDVVLPVYDTTSEALEDLLSEPEEQE